MKDLYSQFADWVKLQPRDAEYEYDNNTGCAFCQFLSSVGVNFVVVMDDYWLGDLNTRHNLEREFAEALACEPHTFGALSDRLAQGEG